MINSNNLIPNNKYIYERRKGCFIKVKYIGEITRGEVKYEFNNLDFYKGCGPRIIRIKKGSWRLNKLIKYKTEVKKK